MKRWTSVVAALWAACAGPVVGGCAGPVAGGDELDLDAPAVVAESLPRGPIGVTDAVVVVFDEPVAAATIDESSVMIVADRLGAPCTVDLACEPGRCLGGWCQQVVVGPQWIADAANPPLSDARLAQAVLLERTLDPSGRRLRLQPRRPLAAKRWHTLLVSRSVRDLAGNSLVDRTGQGGFVARLVTDDGRRARPTVRLLSPPARATDLPINLRQVIVGFSRAVEHVDSSNLGLSVGGRPWETRLQHDSPLCVGWSAGNCIALQLKRALPPLTEVRLVGEAQIEDREGRALLPPLSQRFATGAAADHQRPGVSRPTLVYADGCLVLRLGATELSHAVLLSDEPAGTALSLAARRHELALRRVDQERPRVSLHVDDLAGNRTNVLLPELEPGQQTPLTISEVLADPLGPEPRQEFVELRNLGSMAVNLNGWSLEDGEGRRLPLPPALLSPGQRAVLVGPGFRADGGTDPPPDARALLLELPRALGLGNDGEPLLLRDSAGKPVSSYGGHHPAGAENGAGTSIERVGECDVAASWRPNPSGSSTPGW